MKLGMSKGVEALFNNVIMYDGAEREPQLSARKFSGSVPWLRSISNLESVSRSMAQRVEYVDRLKWLKLQTSKVTFSSRRAKQAPTAQFGHHEVLTAVVEYI